MQCSPRSCWPVVTTFVFTGTGTGSRSFDWPSSGISHGTPQAGLLLEPHTSWQPVQRGSSRNTPEATGEGLGRFLQGQSVERISLERHQKQPQIDVSNSQSEESKHWLMSAFCCRFQGPFFSQGSASASASTSATSSASDCASERSSLLLQLSNNTAINK
jgi:hypothetical protein